MKVRESNRIRMQLIQGWSLQDRIAVAGQVPVTLIISQDEDDVWLALSLSQGFVS